MEEDLFHLLVAPPPPQPRTLSVAGARVLAGQLRDAVGRRHERAVARVGASQACPFDLHALVAVPNTVLRLGPDDPIALAWLWEHWGTTEALRHVAEEVATGQAEPWRSALAAGQDGLYVAFWSADWTPWRARQCWPSAGRDCVLICDRATPDRDRHRLGGRQIGGTPGGDCRLGGSPARRFGGLGAGALDRRFRGTARLAVGDGAGPENRSGTPVDRVPHRGVCDRPGRRTGASDRSPHCRAGALGRLVGHGGNSGVLPLRLLLPSDSPEARAAEDEAEALRRRLVSRAQMRAAADWLERRPQLGREVFGRGAADSREAGGRVGDITELLRACLVALRVPEQADVYAPRPAPLWQVGDAIAHMRQLLGALPDGSPLTAFLPKVGGAEPGRALRCRVAMSSTLVAGLELARTGDLTLDQDAPWTPVRCSAAIATMSP